MTEPARPAPLYDREVSYAAAPATSHGAARALEREKVVVGFVDDHVSGADALRLGRALATLCGSDLEVATIVSPTIVGGRERHAERELRAARTAQRGARLDPTGRARSIEITCPGVAEGLHHLAGPHTRAIVVGRPAPHHLPGRRSTTETVLRGSPVPVAVAARGLQPDTAIRRVHLTVAPRHRAMSADEAISEVDADLATLVAFARDVRRAAWGSGTHVDITLTAVGSSFHMGELLDERIAEAARYIAAQPTGPYPDPHLAHVPQLTDDLTPEDLLVRVGRAHGPNGALRAGTEDLHLIRRRTPSLLLLAPRPISAPVLP